jgi:hypothetical protein
VLHEIKEIIPRLRIEKMMKKELSSEKYPLAVKHLLKYFRTDSKLIKTPDEESG